MTKLINLNLLIERIGLYTFAIVIAGVVGAKAGTA